MTAELTTPNAIQQASPPAKRKGGRPTKRTPERMARILDEVRTGRPLKTAALLAGISEDTLHDWRRDDARFRELVEGAIAEAETALIERIRDASKDDWRASAFLLERRHPEHWGKKAPADVTHAHVHAHIASREVLSVLAELRRQRDARDLAVSGGATVLDVVAEPLPADA